MGRMSRRCVCACGGIFMLCSLYDRDREALGMRIERAWILDLGPWTGGKGTKGYGARKKIRRRHRDGWTRGGRNWIPAYEMHCCLCFSLWGFSQSRFMNTYILRHNIK